MKKKLLTGLIGIGAAASALAQGTVVFEGNVYVQGGPGTYAGVGTYTVALLWAPGTSLVPQGSLAILASFGPNSFSFSSMPAFFTDGNTITTGPGTAGGTAAMFEVEGWTGSFASYAAAVAGGAKVDASAEFVNGTGTPTPPATPPVNITGWNGYLNLHYVPEPGPLAVAALGAAGIWWHARRRE